MSNKPSTKKGIGGVEAVGSIWGAAIGLSSGLSLLVIGMVLSALLGMANKPGASSFFFNVAAWLGGGTTMVSGGVLAVQGTRSANAIRSQLSQRGEEKK
jgi:hypothetical protein